MISQRFYIIPHNRPIMGEHYCGYCRLIYSIGIHPKDCDDMNGNVKLGVHDVKKGSYYVWERNMYSSNLGGGFASTIRLGQGSNSHQKTKILFIDCDDFANNLSDILEEICLYLTKNSITEQIVIKGTLEQLAKARLSTGGCYRRLFGRGEIVYDPSRDGAIVSLVNNLRFLKKIGIRVSLLVYDDSTKRITSTIPRK